MKKVGKPICLLICFGSFKEHSYYYALENSISKTNIFMFIRKQTTLQKIIKSYGQVLKDHLYGNGIFIEIVDKRGRAVCDVCGMEDSYEEIAGEIYHGINCFLPAYDIGIISSYAGQCSDSRGKKGNGLHCVIGKWGMLSFQ